MGKLKLRPIPPSANFASGYSLRDDQKGHRVCIVYERNHAMQIIQAVNYHERLVNMVTLAADSIANQQVYPDAPVDLTVLNLARALLAEIKEKNHE